MGFSALQRAENSSMDVRSDKEIASYLFQCSSASRKFLNIVLALCAVGAAVVSVLFSEPKIPQLIVKQISIFARVSFSALQRAENSSMLVGER